MDSSFVYKLLFYILITAFMPFIGAQEKNQPKNADKTQQTCTSTDKWQQATINHIQTYKYYPIEARKNKLEGVVMIEVTINLEGDLIDAKVLKTSNSQLLDDASINMMKKASPYPKPPKQLLKNGTLQLIIPLSYTLKDHNPPDSVDIFSKNIEDTPKQLLVFLYLINIFMFNLLI